MVAEADQDHVELKIGDLVQLKSGGPIMTVDWIKGPGGEARVKCCWFKRVGKGTYEAVLFQEFRRAALSKLRE